MGFITIQTENSALAFISGLSVYFVATRLVSGACLVLQGNSFWLYFIFLFFVLHSIPHKSNSHSDCFIHLNGHMCVCVCVRMFKWTESCVCSHLLVNWCIFWGYRVLLNLSVHYCVWCLSIFICPTHFHILVIDMYDLNQQCVCIYIYIYIYILQSIDRGMRCKL